MSTLPTATRNAAADAIVDLVDAGSAAGKIVIGTSGMAATIAVLPMSDPAFGAASGGTATASAITDDSSADSTGVAEAFEMRDSDDTVVVSGTVTDGTSAGDIELSSVTITAGDTVSLSAFTVAQDA